MAPLFEIDTSIPATFLRRVEENPTSPALVLDDRTISYGDLEEQSRRISSAILDRGMATSQPVTILTSDYAQLVPALLGVIRAGAFYTVIDPRYPPARIAGILEDADAVLLLADRSTMTLAASLPSAPQVVAIEDSISTSPRAMDDLPDPSPDDLAYLVYTSGSTGRPRGVMQTHRNVLHNMRHYIGRIGLGPHDRMSFLFSPSFAGAVSDIFGALLSGASIHPFAVRSQPLTRLGEWLIQSRITVYHSVPTLFRRLMPLATEPFPDIRIVKLGGEAVTVNDFELFRSHFPDTCRFHFGLTASETNFVCDELLDRSSSLEGHQVPLGLPIEDKRVMILDDQGQPVPQGETGEIAVESRYLSPGYWGTPREIGDRPEFPGNSGLSPISGSRIYRMGDLGKILPDGRIVHLGRKDNQVKIRGHRVELSEIDLALQADPAVREAVTIARPDASGELSLVSFVVAAREEIEEGTLRSALRSRLPEAFIPAAIQLVPDLPRNPNGKIDRSALAAIEISRGETAARRGDSTIDRLHEIWVESGGRAGIAADNDLFACGDSLGVIHFFGAVEIAFHRRLPLTSLMQSVTLARVAEILDRESELDTRRIFPLRTSGDRQRLFFIPGMGAHFLGILKLTKALGEEYPCYGVQYSGVDGDATRRLDRVETIAADFLELIRSIQPAGPYALIGSSFGGVVAWEMGLQLLAAGERVTFLGLLDTRCPSAAKLPPWRRAAELRREGKSVLRYSVWWFRRMAGMPWRRIRALFAHRLVGRDSSLPQALRVVELRNMNAAERYRVRPYPFSATLFRASEGIVKLTRDPSLGWRQWAGELEVIEVPGSHRTMTRGREVVELAAALRAALDRATARAGAAEAGQKPAVDDCGRDVEF